jgi:hypothetical protein
MAAFSTEQRIQLRCFASQFGLIAAENRQYRPAAADSRAAARDIGEVGWSLVPRTAGWKDQ